jgi:hypothetical protein
MAITSDIVAAWRSPRQMIRSKLALGESEASALATIMGTCVLIFVAQWPRLSREAHMDPSVPLDARLGGALMACLFIVPLFAYGIAALSHLFARAMGGKGTWYGARLALFWALLAATPLMLLHGLLSGFLGQGVQATAVGLLVLAAFLYIWGNMLIGVER